MAMECSKCGKVNPDHVMFCGYCGSEIPESLRPKGQFFEPEFRTPKCPQCGRQMQEGYMGINAYGPIGGILYAESPKWYAEKSLLGTGGESLNLSAGLERIFYLRGYRCPDCRQMLLSY